MVTIKVCIGSACYLKGAYNIIQGIQKIIIDRRLEDKVTVKAAFCLGNCTKAVSCKVDDGEVISVSSKSVESFFKQYIEGRL